MEFIVNIGFCFLDIDIRSLVWKFFFGTEPLRGKVSLLEDVIWNRNRGSVLDFVDSKSLPSRDLSSKLRK